ncbi:MerR family transcriptional regulator [Lactococcus protaetiae]|uniref:MerR family transcriptional regulator n=1 Tax=Lactococcus protaetiae TaxID=2592653 RepID=A0A514Z5Y9_9LACT|nr:MerR family transcriptional regulator [Lactococcus protaetiae]QDK69917.1 MerR family transcriptional regulator [Lactococcus protaetiae]
MTTTYKISEISALTGLSISTLRYYEDLELLKPQRNTNNYRVFTDDDLRWIEFISRAKATGMALTKIVEYSKLREQGEHTIIQRISLLIEQEKILLTQKEEIENHIKFLQDKKHHYYDLLEKRNSEN